MNILHIEDRRENRLLVRKLLESQGFTVNEAVDGLAGIEMAERTRPDLILLDINIPALDGYEVVTKLKGDARLTHTPVVAITAEGDRTRALALGFDGFIMKPIQITTFADEIRAFLGGKRETVDDAERAGHLADHSRRTVDRLEAKVRELTKANERLREVDRLKMEVLRNVSHELSTPLTPLVGYVKMLAGGEIGPVTAGQQRVLERMGASLGRLKELIDNLLNVTRFATGSVQLECSVCDVGAVVDGAVAALAERAGRRGIRLEVGRPPQSEPLIGDPARLGDALRQVLDNAVKFSPDGGRVRVDVRTLVEGDADRRLVEVAVTDEGPGIPPDERDRVIEPFYQIDGSVTRAYGGAGLGLAVAERTARLHQGRLVITGAPDGGARVALRIPLRPAE
jgi:signal transduction histidine kinase